MLALPRLIDRRSMISSVFRGRPSMNSSALTCAMVRGTPQCVPISAHSATKAWPAGVLSEALVAGGWVMDERVGLAHRVDHLVGSVEFVTMPNRSHHAW